MSEEKSQRFNKLRVIVSLVIEKNGKFLFTRQAPHAPRDPGKWFFPGGNIELGESLEEAIKREAKEEIGVEVEFLGLVDYGEYIKAPYHILALFCRCKIVKGEPAPQEETDKVKWVAVGDINRYSLRPIIKARDIAALIRDLRIS